MKNKRSTHFVPLFVSIAVIIGIVIGTLCSNYFSGGRLSIINTSSNKINDLLHYIDDQYVDSVDIATLVESAMPQILSELDPHSTYISAKDAEEVTNDLKGSFSGIGVRFSIHDDTIHISNVIKGGPSEKVGLMGGDRIVSIDGESFVGDSVTNQEAMRRLKGTKGTEISLGVKRNGEPDILKFNIVRGDIPTKSVEATYMIDEIGRAHV